MLERQVRYEDGAEFYLGYPEKHSKKQWLETKSSFKKGIGVSTINTNKDNISYVFYAFSREHFSVEEFET